jgi:diacylglycerol kinase family enzyme
LYEARLLPGAFMHLFIINPKSFRKKAELEAVSARIEEVFKDGRHGDYAVYVSQFPRDAIGEIRKRIEAAGKDEKVRVYAVGGDGILFDCLNGVVGLANAELASVPYGRSNDFIRAFGEGLSDRFRDIEALAAAPVFPTDLIYYGNNYALNVCTIGLESVAVIKMAELNKRHPKFLAMFPFFYDFMFFFGGFLAIFDRELLYQRYEITIDGEDYSGTYSAINISNGPCYGGDKSAVPSAVPDDGLLDVLLFKSIGTLKTLGVISRYIQGRAPPKYRLLRRAKKISIRSELPLLIGMDGEVLFDNSITVEVAPGAVKIAAMGDLHYEKRSEFHE